VAAVISRCARVFAGVMLQKHLDRQTTERELALFAEVIEASHDLRTIWRNPSVPGVQKRKVLDWIVVRGGMSRMVRNLIAVLIDRHRISALREVMRQLEIGLNQRMGITQAEVTTAPVRGQRLVEFLKQGQYARLSFAKPNLIIYPGMNGFLDDLAVKDVRTGIPAKCWRREEQHERCRQAARTHILLAECTSPSRSRTPLVRQALCDAVL